MEAAEYELIYVVVNFGMGSKVLKIAKHNGISGGTIFLGMGTVKSRFLQFLELTDIRKEIVLMVSDKKYVETVIQSLDEEIKFKKPNHGIVFTMPLSIYVGLEENRRDYIYKSYGGEIMYNSIFTVVNRGKGEDVMEAATAVGARGGTIIKGRGTGINETSKLFHMDIEPEKEIVMILVETANTEKIVNSIRDQLEIDKDGNGIIFCQDVNRAYGINQLK